MKRPLPITDRRGLLRLGDTLAILLAVLLALTIWLIVDGRGWEAGFILSHGYWFPLLAGLWLLLAQANDLYHRRITARFDTSLMRLVAVTSQTLVVYLVIFFISPRDALPRLFILYYAVLSFTFIAIWRMAALARTSAGRRALIVGGGPAAQSLVAALAHEAPNDYVIAGLILEPGEAAPDDLPAPLGTGADLLVIAQREQVADIILAHQEPLSATIFQAVMDCYEQGHNVVAMAVVYEQVTGRVPVAHVGQQTWLLPAAGGSIFDLYPVVKRGMDIVLALVGLGIFGLILLPVALAIRLESPGPVFFAQVRIGRGGRPFRLWKLRSMIPDAEADTGPQWATDDDPRVTRVGRLLRRTRLDEVPQLITVLRGDMSLIGPRPERPEFVRDLAAGIPYYRTRHAVKPGITGWAQVHHPYGNTPADALVKLEYDLYYIRHRSLALDLLILLRTAGQMLSLRGT